MAEEEDGSFLSRWSRRKVVARTGVQQPPVQTANPTQAGTTQAGTTQADTTPGLPAVRPGEPAVQHLPPALAPADAQTGPLAPHAPAAPPTLADVATLTRESDFSRFVAGNVSPEVKNAALKQLFTDPHFNVMDGLDIYIGDYNTPDPLPPGMLRQMVQSQLLGIFEDDKTDAAASAASTPIETPTTTHDGPVDPALTASTAPGPTDRIAPPPTHENPDLQLQPDDATGRPAAAAGAGEDPGRAHRGP